jgi:hypothetical protein
VAIAASSSWPDAHQALQSKPPHDTLHAPTIVALVINLGASCSLCHRDRA